MESCKKFHPIFFQSLLQNNVGANSIEIITSNYFFHYTIAWNHLKEKFQNFMANHILSKPDVGINGMVIEELKDAKVDVVLTWAQLAKAGIPLMIDSLKEKEPENLKTNHEL